MKGIVALLILTVVALLISLFFRVGAFKKVVISERNSGPYKTVFKKHLGAYHKTVTVIEEVEAWARKNGEKCELSFGRYFDDPDQTPEDRLHSFGGCVVEKPWLQGLPPEFEYAELESRPYVIAEFSGAPSIGPFKVYPRVKSYLANHNLRQDGAVIEIYHVKPEDQVETTYLFPVAPVAANAP